jgi:hypothetical protein
VGRVRVEIGDGDLHASPRAVPHFPFRIAGPHEHHTASLAKAAEQQRCAGLLEPGQVVQVGVLPVLVLDVVVPDGHGRRRQQQGRVGSDCLEHPLTPTCVLCSVRHWLRSLPRPGRRGPSGLTAARPHGRRFRVQSEPPAGEGEPGERDRRRLERLIPEIVKRVLDVGYGKISEGPENVRNFVSELKLPKEALSVLLAQIDETKTGLYRVVAKEIRDFLEHGSFSDELARVLTGMTLEIKTELRFLPRDGAAQPDVKTEVKVRQTPPPDGETSP